MERRVNSNPLFDLNAYCVGHITGDKGFRSAANIPNKGDAIFALPENFATEAQALGAGIEITGNGFESPAFLYTDPVELNSLPRIEESKQIKSVLQQIKNASCPNILLKLNGPFSILASVIEPKLFYRWLKKYPDEINGALERITGGLASYVAESISSGARIISMADPFLNPDLVGPELYKKYGAYYFVKLLRHISAESSSGIVHICPHTSIPLETYGYLKLGIVEPIKFATQTYIEGLFKSFTQKNVIFTGHQCIYTEQAKFIQTLELFPL
jgi:uroporphyrinogen-III decarboxylase